MNLAIYDPLVYDDLIHELIVQIIRISVRDDDSVPIPMMQTVYNASLLALLHQPVQMVKLIS
jgi:hypothetical protein